MRRERIYVTVFDPDHLIRLLTDRTGLKNLSAEHPDIVEKLSAKWDAWGEENFVAPLPEELQVDYLKVK